jgi:glyoxylase-like metal-dependent hydrolase (beta-lactamase superfamily II)
MVEVMKGVYTIDLSEPGRLALEVWLLNCPEGTVLIDTGMVPTAIDKIESELKGTGKTWKDIKAVLITHKHGDHVRNLAKVKELSGAEVMSHEGDAADIEKATGVKVRGLKDKEKLPYCGGIEVIHVPGHSEGNCSYYLPTKKVMIAGDTIFGDDQGNLTAPPERYCLDVKQAERGIKRLLDYDFDILFITHGKDTMKDAKSRVKELVEKIGSA